MKLGINKALLFTEGKWYGLALSRHFQDTVGGPFWVCALNFLPNSKLTLADYCHCPPNPQ